ncbi:MAG: 16S rRNA (adenine(1518)-N(6)/adenine(1519)-N(6))-dimethyltransferase RsmA [Corynebacterium sp.]|nr:16S rRNA (adenine(1518)-N(6)/adenine(1519)-N(6))-dimethyltransferase RsmA [Corynebacterium sp.]
MSGIDKAQLLGPVEIRQLAEELDLRPTKKLGQNFVHDPNTVRRIVAEAHIDSSVPVIEVGPGLGSLTLPLLDTAKSVTAVEIDPRLATKLPETVANRAPAFADNLRVINKDALLVNKQDIPTEPRALVANLPYNVSVPVLLHLLEEFPSIERVLVMVQLEVAERLAAKPGSKIFGVPSLKASYYGEVSLAGKIGKNVFWPAPKIESGLVAIDRYKESPWTAPRERIFELIDAAFAQRRKTLRASLSGVCGGAEQAEYILNQAGIPITERGEKLSIEDFHKLAMVEVES